MSIVVSTQRIYLRFIESRDIDGGWLDWINNPKLNKYLSTKGEITREDLVSYMNHSQPPSSYLFAVCMTENDEYIGNVRLSSVDLENNKAVYGRLIGDKCKHGIGIGTESLILLSYFAFFCLNLNRIETGVLRKNIASIKSNIKAGAMQEGIFRESILVNGHYEDVIRFGMLKKDFVKSDKYKFTQYSKVLV